MTLISALTLASAAQVATKALLVNKQPGSQTIMATAQGPELVVVSGELREGEAEVRVDGPAGEVVVVVGKQCGCGAPAITICPHASLAMAQIDKQTEKTIIRALESLLRQFPQPPALMVVIKQIEEELS